MSINSGYSSRYGRIVNFSYDYSCYCCKEVDPKTIQIGDLFVEKKAGGKDFINATSALNYWGRNLEPELLTHPATIPLQKTAIFQYYENLELIKEKYTILDSIDNPKAYLLQNERGALNQIAVKKEDKYVVFSFTREFDNSEYTIKRQNIDGVGNDELIIRRITTREETGEKDRLLERESVIEVWNLDTYSCLLSIQDGYTRNYWQYDSSGKTTKYQSVDRELRVNFDEKQMIIYKYEDRIPGLNYVYKLTESGFVLDKVKDPRIK